MENKQILSSVRNGISGTTTKRRSKTRKSKPPKSTDCNIDVSQISNLSNLSIGQQKENVENGTGKTSAFKKITSTERRSKTLQFKLSESSKCNVDVSQIDDLSNSSVIQRQKNVENDTIEAYAYKKGTTIKPKIRKSQPSELSNCNVGVPQINDPSNPFIIRRKKSVENGTAEAPACKKKSGSNNWEKFLTSNKMNEVKEKDEFDIDDLVDADAQSRLKRANNIVAIDCEMVGVGENGEGDMLARVSIVNSLGDCLYDTFVKPTAPVTDYRTFVSGVRPRDLANAKEFSVVQKKVLALINNRILVGHAIHHDLKVLKIRHPRKKIRDTTQFKKFHQIGVGGTPSLKKLTSHFLNVDIQCGEHCSVQDAQATMQLYMLFRKEWEADVIKRRNAASHHHHHHHPTKKKSKPSHRPKRFGRNYKS